jgi:Na+/melibiose symporter-like transporter
MSWVLEIFGEHGLSPKWLSLWFIVSLTLLAAYMRHAHKHAYPLLDLTLFRIRTFRVSVAGGFITRLGIGACPLLIPLLYQLGLGLPAWQAGLLMTPLALVAISMKMMAPKILACLGYRKILVFNTGMIGITIMSFSLITPATPLVIIVMLSFMMGFFNSLQFTCMNSMAFADIQKADSSMASTITSSLQQFSMSFGLACGLLVTSWFLDGLPQTNHVAILRAVHSAFVCLGLLTLFSSLTFTTLRVDDGETVSGAHVS